MIDNPMPMLAAILATGATASASLKDLTILGNLLIGIGLGTAVGKTLVWRQERRRGRELAGRRQRHIEMVWIMIGAVAALAFSALAALL